MTRRLSLILALALGLTACAQPRASALDPAPRIEVTYYPTPPAPQPLATPAAIAVTSPPTPTPLAVDAAFSQSAVNTVTAPAAPAPLPFLPPGPAAMLADVRHEQQTWNNCGPATIAMLLSHFGRGETQRDAAKMLKPDPEDKNVSPDELMAYAQSLGLEARVIVGGDLDVLRTLVSNGLPVIVETWFIPEPDDEMGHYQLVVGYDGDAFALYDSYEGPNIRQSAATLDALWKVFNRTAILAWTPEQGPLVRAILGDLADDRTMHARALAQAQADLATDPQDKFAWFNAGSSALALGDSAAAAEAYDRARALRLPWRMMWYQFGPYAAYFEQGRFRDVIDLASVTLGRVKNLEESLYWRGLAYQAVGSPAAARRDFEQALKFNPNYAVAREALAALKAGG